jgi:signal transduction histidine kinase
LKLEQPADQALAPIADLARDTMLLVLLALLILAGVFGALAARLMRPLGSLLGGVRKVAGGRLDARVEVRSNDEFGELANDFNAMIGTLEQRTAQLLTAQQELVEKEKSAMLGRVAGSVAHELRNPLGVMSNGIYFLRCMPHAQSDATTREYLDMIEAEIERAKRIISELLDSVRTQPPVSQTVALAELLAETRSKLTVPQDVVIEVDIPAHVPPVRVDPAQIAQVLRNLLGNAFDAMPEGGTLEIRARQQGQAVTVNVRDSGTGIAPEDLARVFQPLFTTKARGIGLGLVVAKNLTEANGGTLHVQSEPGKGTTFTLIVPAALTEEIVNA